MGTGRTTTFLTPIGDVERKRALLTDRRDDVLAAIDAVEPLLPAIERAALLVEDDLCVLVRDGDTFVLGAGCVCAPSHWSLRDKLGLPITAIHSRVPFYATELASRVDNFLSRLRTGQVVARRNWSVHETPELFVPADPPFLGVPPPEQWLRSERQTLSRMDRSGAVLFTIRTDQVQLKDLPADVRRRLAARLRAEPADLIGYRDLTARRPTLTAWLAS
jgi:hypothetical protein